MESKSYELYYKDNLNKIITTINFNEWCSYESPLDKAIHKFALRLNKSIYDINQNFTIKELK